MREDPHHPLIIEPYLNQPRFPFVPQESGSEASSGADEESEEENDLQDLLKEFGKDSKATKKSFMASDEEDSEEGDESEISVSAFLTREFHFKKSSNSLSLWNRSQKEPTILKSVNVIFPIAGYRRRRLGRGELWT